MQQTISNPLDWGPISLIRRNHGLEHATLNLLNETYPHKSFAGYSDTKGFWVIGDISTDTLYSVASAALERMKNGEHHLAVHPNCGTNYVTAGVVAGTLAWLGTLGTAKSWKKKVDRWPYLVLLVTSAFIAAQPLGPKVQKAITTDGNPRDLVITQITRYERQGPVLHRVRTSVSSQEETPAAEEQA